MNSIFKNPLKNYRCWSALTFFLMVITLSLFFCTMGFTQGKETKLRVYYHVFSFPSTVEKKSNFQVYLEVPYSELSFLKQEETYKASYQVDLMLFSDQEPVLDRSWKRNLTLFSFDETQSISSFALWNYSDDLTPGNYEMDITVTDQNSMASIHGKQVITMKDFNKRGVNVSDIAFLTDLTEEANGKRTMVPSLRNNINADDKKFFAYIEIASEKKNTNLDIVYKVIDDITGTNQPLKQGKVQIPKKGTIEYFSLNMLDLKLNIGRYNLLLEVSEGSYTKEVSKPFSVQWAWIPPSIKDYQLAIKQMMYITTDKEQKHLENLQGSDQVKEFKAFWDSVNTNPLAEESAPMFEYYDRINYATQHFSTYSKWQDGWKSDRGRVFIMMGEPDEVVHNPNSMDSKPYDVWYYYAPRRRMFVFIDQSGLGDYRLQNIQDLDPKESTWSRIRGGKGR